MKLSLLLILALVFTQAVAKPVLEHDLKVPPRAQLEGFAREIMALSEAEVLTLVPTQTPFITSDCPHCGAAQYTRGLERALWKFTYLGQLTCLQCSSTFPGERFPLNDKATFLNTLGEKVEIAFHRDAKGRRFALPGMLQSWQNGWLTQRLEALAKLYQLTKEESYARRVALVLDRYADVFPHYLVKDFLTETLHDPAIRQTQKSSYVYVSTGGPFMKDGRKYAERPTEPAASQQRTTLPYGWTQSRWGWGRWGNDFPSDLLRICDLVYESPAFEALSKELGHSVREHLVKDLFGNSVGYIQEYPFYYQLNNNASSHIGELIRAGRVLQQPEWVHFGYRWSREVLEQYAFSRDGAFAESPGYLYVFLATQEANFTALAGYSDPPGFVGKDGLHLENLGAGGSAAFLQKAREATESIRFPNGSSLPLGDNRNDDYLEPLFRPGARGTALERSRNVLLPGYGHAVLGDGAADRQVHAHLQFSTFPGVVHTHMDALSLMLWAFGSEILTDVGYHKSKYRGYATTTLSHNTVVIDRTPQHGTDTKGSILMYEPNLPGLSLIQVEARGAYEGTTSRYRRTLLLNSRDLEAPYLIDVFEVRGGRMHDYALHGPTLFESQADTALPLKPMAGERPLLLPEEKWTDDTAKNPYGVFTKVRSGPVTEDFAVTFRLIDPYSRPEFYPNDRYHPDPSFHYAADPAAYRDKGEIGVRSYFPSGFGERQVFLSESPSMIRSGLSGSKLTEKLKRPSLLVRAEGQDGLSSVFVAVHEPYYGQPKLTAVKRLPDEKGVALQIVSGVRSDTFRLSLEEPRVEFGSTGDKPASVVIQPAYRGEISAVSSKWNGGSANAFTTKATLPTGKVLQGAWVLATLGANGPSEAFEIESVASKDGWSWIYLKDDPGLEMKDGKTREIFFPRRSFGGPSSFVIHAPMEAKP